MGEMMNHDKYRQLNQPPEVELTLLTKDKSVLLINGVVDRFAGADGNFYKRIIDHGSHSIVWLIRLENQPE